MGSDARGPSATHFPLVDTVLAVSRTARTTRIRWNLTPSLDKSMSQPLVASKALASRGYGWIRRTRAPLPR